MTSPVVKNPPLQLLQQLQSSVEKLHDRKLSHDQLRIHLCEMSAVGGDDYHRRQQHIGAFVN